MPSTTIADHGLAIDLDSDAAGATQEEIDAWLEEGKGGFTVEQLQEAFRSVQDKEHWKNPIDAVVDRDQTAVLDKAIPFMTGTPAEFEDVEGQPGKVRVTADGYFLGPCN